MHYFHTKPQKNSGEGAQHSPHTQHPEAHSAPRFCAFVAASRRLDSAPYTLAQMTPSPLPNFSQHRIYESGSSLAPVGGSCPHLPSPWQRNGLKMVPCLLSRLTPKRVAQVCQHQLSFLFTTKYPRAQLIRSSQSRRMFQQYRTSTDHFSTCVFCLLSSSFIQPRGRDLLTTVRWPTGQRAATGGKVTTSRPMYGTNAALDVTYTDAQRDPLSNCPK